ncbi:hypothetical protein BJV78DRAFT_1156161 [Lactifluus subvellereus]|nr:hypothetical protein BJV78DRAFT_1156161 [Lactifluus subvellereus]
MEPGSQAKNLVASSPGANSCGPSTTSKRITTTMRYIEVLGPRGTTSQGSSYCQAIGLLVAIDLTRSFYMAYKKDLSKGSLAMAPAPWEVSVPSKEIIAFTQLERVTNLGPEERRYGREKRGVELSPRDSDMHCGLGHATVGCTIGTKQRARYDGTHARITRHARIPRLRRMAGLGREEVTAATASCEKTKGGGPQKASSLWGVLFLGGCSLLIRATKPRGCDEDEGSTRGRGVSICYISDAHSRPDPTTVGDRRKWKGGSLIYRIQFRHGTTRQNELPETCPPLFGHPAGSALERRARCRRERGIEGPELTHSPDQTHKRKPIRESPSMCPMFILCRVASDGVNKLSTHPTLPDLRHLARPAEARAWVDPRN